MLHSAYNASTSSHKPFAIGIPVAQHLGQPERPLSLDQTILFGRFTPAI